MDDIKINGVYKHFKGDYYIVLGVAINSETGEYMVVYRALYGNNELYVRPMDMFLEEVNRNNQKYRFELQNISSKNK